LRWGKRKTMSPTSSQNMTGHLTLGFFQFNAYEEWDAFLHWRYGMALVIDRHPAWIPHRQWMESAFRFQKIHSWTGDFLGDSVLCRSGREWGTFWSGTKDCWETEGSPLFSGSKTQMRMSEDANTVTLFPAEIDRPQAARTDIRRDTRSALIWRDQRRTSPRVLNLSNHWQHGPHLIQPHLKLNKDQIFKEICLCIEKVHLSWFPLA
jgi:hypothetical protein